MFQFDSVEFFSFFLGEKGNERTNRDKQKEKNNDEKTVFLFFSWFLMILERRKPVGRWVSSFQLARRSVATKNLFHSGRALMKIRRSSKNRAIRRHSEMRISDSHETPNEILIETSFDRLCTNKIFSFEFVFATRPSAFEQRPTAENDFVSFPRANVSSEFIFQFVLEPSDFVDFVRENFGLLEDFANSFVRRSNDQVFPLDRGQVRDSRENLLPLVRHFSVDVFPESFVTRTNRSLFESLNSTKNSTRDVNQELARIWKHRINFDGKLFVEKNDFDRLTADIIFPFLQTVFFGLYVNSFAVKRIVFIVEQTFQFSEENVTEPVGQTTAGNVDATGRKTRSRVSSREKQRFNELGRENVLTEESRSSFSKVRRFIRSKINQSVLFAFVDFARRKKRLKSFVSKMFQTFVITRAMLLVSTWLNIFGGHETWEKLFAWIVKNEHSCEEENRWKTSFCFSFLVEKTFGEIDALVVDRRFLHEEMNQRTNRRFVDLSERIVVRNQLREKLPADIRQTDVNVPLRRNATRLVVLPRKNRRDNEQRKDRRNESIHRTFAIRERIFDSLFIRIFIAKGDLIVDKINFSPQHHGNGACRTSRLQRKHSIIELRFN